MKLNTSENASSGHKSSMSAYILLPVLNLFELVVNNISETLQHSMYIHDVKFRSHGGTNVNTTILKFNLLVVVLLM